jgi:hypothetical protein
MGVVYDAGRHRALQAAISYLGEQYRGRLEIMDALPEYEKRCLYNAEKMDECWSLYVPEADLIVGGARILCISKKTFRVIFDGRLGE